jgi:hypothetical protein
MSRAIRWGVAVVVVAVVAVLVYGFFTADDQAIEAEARKAACSDRGPRCHAALARFLKTPFFQDRQFRVDGASVDVRCTRTGYLFGDYRCATR